MVIDESTNIKQLFDDTFQSSQTEINNYIQAQRKINNLCWSPAEEEKFKEDILVDHAALISELKEIRDFGYYLRYNDSDFLFSVFQERCVGSQNINDEAEILKRSCIIKGKLVFIEDIIQDIDKELDPFKKSFFNDLFYIFLNSLETFSGDTETQQNLLSKYNDIEFVCNNSILPFNYLYKDIYKSCIEYFTKRFTYISKNLKSQPKTKNFINIENNLKELKKQKLLLNTEEIQISTWQNFLYGLLKLESNYKTEIERISKYKNYFSVFSCLDQLNKDTASFINTDIKELEFEKSLELSINSEKELLISRYEELKNNLKLRNNYAELKEINSIEGLTERLITVYPDVIESNIANGKLFFTNCQEIIDLILSFHTLSLMKQLRVQIESYVQIPEVPKSEIKKDDYFKFLDLFRYNYSYEYCTISFVHMIKEYSDYLKKEILSNFINLNLDEKLDYLEWLKFDIEKLKENVWSTKDRLDKWYKKYNVPEDFVWNGNYYSNELYRFLQSDRASFKETLKDDYNPDKEASMDDFYNYYYGQGVDDMLTFIDLQTSKLKPDLKANTKIVSSSNSSGNLPSTFTPAFLDFLELADITLKYRSHWSCSSFYSALHESYLDIKANIQSQFITIPVNDRELFVDAHLQKISNVLKLYPGGSLGYAESYLKHLNTTLENLFDRLIFADEDSNLKKLPFCLRLNYEDFTAMIQNATIYDTRVSFFHYISDYYTDKLVAFFLDLQTPFLTIKPTEITPSPIKENFEKIIGLSFTYKNYDSNQSAVTDLMDSLKKNKFVHPDTSLSDFRKIFTNKKPDNPIVWIGNFSELSYFVKYLHNESNFIEDLKHDIWKITAKLFVDANGKPFDKTKFRTQKNPARAELLEKAINNLG